MQWNVNVCKLSKQAMNSLRDNCLLDYYQTRRSTNHGRESITQSIQIIARETDLSVAQVRKILQTMGENLCGINRGKN